MNHKLYTEKFEKIYPDLIPQDIILEQIEIRGEPLISQNNLKFKDGLNIIAGHTGTGKTMILKIINFLVNPSDKKESFLSNAKIKYSLNSKAFGLEQETIEVVITENLLAINYVWGLNVSL